MSTATEAKERPILMHARSVRGINEGRKTQTRRIVKPQPEPPDAIDNVGDGESLYIGVDGEQRVVACPYGIPGDRLYVRETWAAVVPGGNCDEITGPPSSFPACWRIPGVCRYKADGDRLADSDPAIRGFRWRPSIHMPKWAARIWLEVTDVRVERVQEICEMECYAEGISDTITTHPDDHMERVIEDFRKLWDDTNAHRDGCTWQDNPWVWVVTFERTEAP